ncbi:MAG: LysM peptidoglycan-binding domain-containing protein [Alistipes indistinctus]
MLQAQQPAERSSSRVTIAGETFYVHTVKPGETFYSLGKLYDTDEETIRARNPIVIDGLRPGQVLKIPIVNGNKKTLSARKMNKLFDTHVVNQGETAYSISKRYGISLATLMEDNPGFDPAHLSIGQKVNVRIESQGEASGAEIEQELDTYKEALDNLSPVLRIMSSRRARPFTP